MRFGRLNIDFGLILPSIIVMVATSIAGSAFFLQSRSVMSAKIREELLIATALGAARISGDDLAEIQGPESQGTPMYFKVVEQLRDIRRTIPNARFSYIFRRTGRSDTLAFVADADATSSVSEMDHNGNGIVDSNEVAAVPGELYDISKIPELQHIAFLEPIVGAVYTDQWGSLLSAFAPIHDARGKVVAVLGIDMDAGEFLNLSQSAFSPISLLMVLLFGAVGSTVLGYSAWHRRMKFYVRLDEERSALVGLAMHQIGAPLSTMRWWVDLLKENDPEHASTENAEAFGQIEEAITRMSGLIESLRKATSLAGGKLTTERLRTDVYELIEKAMERHEVEAKKKDQKIELDMEQQVEIDVDRELIGGVLEEVIGNAVTFSPEHTIMNIKVEKHGGKVTITVQDHGYGIPSMDLPKMFREFTRGSNASKYKPVGNGLGLYMSKRIVKLSGGDMWLQSEEGKGTTVTIVLPLK